MTIWQKEHSYLGTEYDWLATDVDGYIGYFASAGFGPLPVQILELGDTVYEIIERALKLPARGEAVILRESGNISDWITMAEKGLYAYDWDHVNENYHLVARPVKPITIGLVSDRKIVSLAQQVVVKFSIPNQEIVVTES